MGCKSLGTHRVGAWVGPKIHFGVCGEEKTIWYGGSIWCVETSVTTSHQRCVTSQKSEDLIYIAAEAWNRAVKCIDSVTLGTDRLFRNVDCLALEDGTDRLLPNVGKYQFTLCNIQEERRPHLHRGRNLKSQSLVHLCIYLLVIYLPTLSVIRIGCRRVIDGSVWRTGEAVEGGNCGYI